MVNQYKTTHFHLHLQFVVEFVLFFLISALIHQSANESSAIVYAAAIHYFKIECDIAALGIKDKRWNIFFFTRTEKIQLLITAGEPLER